MINQTAVSHPDAIFARSAKIETARRKIASAYLAAKKFDILGSIWRRSRPNPGRGGLAGRLKHAMTDQAFSLVIRGGTAVLPQGVARVDIGIRDETILAIGENLGRGANEIDAAGLIVAPGGVDPHAHIAKISDRRGCNPGAIRGSPGQQGRLLVSRSKNSANLFRNVREIEDNSSNQAPVEWELKVRSVPLGRAISRKLARRYSVIKRSKQ
jgi:hypothetical protein